MINASIVVHRSPEEQLKKALDCLQKSEVGKIFIIDNSPTDFLKKITKEYPKAEYYHVENRGFGAGHNIALNKSIEDGADYHLVMNADVCWLEDVISSLKRYMENNPDIGLISPKTFYPNGELQNTFRMLPTPLDLLVKRFVPGKLRSQMMKRYLLQDHDPDKPLNCPYLLGSFMFFRIDALKDTGLFDERFFMYPEDIDITRRVHEKWKTLYWPGTSIIHEHQRASAKNLRMFWIHFSNMVKYFNKWGWFKDSGRKEFNKRLQSNIS